MRIACGAALAAAIAWCAWIALHPTWIGRFHDPARDGSAAWLPGGAFAVAGGAPAAAVAPIWAPPAPHAGNIAATARWPWQPVTQRAHVEIVVADWARSWAFAVLAVGAMLVAVQRALDRATPRRLVTVWSSLALALGAAWLGILGLQAVGGGQVPPREWEPGVFGVAAVAGVAAGTIRHRRVSAKTARQSADGRTRREDAPS